MATPKTRADVLLVARGLAESREKAQRLIHAGAVRMGTQAVAKPGQLVADTADLQVAAPPRFVSRGGEKLEAAFVHFGLDVAGRVCLDVGASTGGFTDCLLQHGAAKVHAVDVGRGQLHWKLRQDPRVVIHDQLNARGLCLEDLGEAPAVATIDVAFISLTKILPPVKELLVQHGVIVALIKPQFEAGRDAVGKGGVVRDPQVHEQVIQGIRTFGEETVGLTWRGRCVSPITGPAGNQEFLSLWTKP